MNPFYAPPPGRFYTPIHEAVDPSLYEYNSNSTIPAYYEQGPKPLAATFMDEVESQFVGAKEVNHTYLQRTKSVYDHVKEQDKNIIQYAVQPDPVMFPGFVPKMKNVPAEDVAVPMKEGFQILPVSLEKELESDRKAKKSTQTCIDFLNHVKHCPLCQRYFQCDNRMYYVVILSLIIIFGIILYFVTKDSSTNMFIHHKK